MSPGNLHSVVCYNFLNIYLSSLSALCSLSSVKCFHSIFFPPQIFIFCLFSLWGSGGALAGNHIFSAPDFCHFLSSLCFKCVFSGQEQKGLSQIQVPGSAFPSQGQAPQVSLLSGGNRSLQLRGQGWTMPRESPQNAKPPPLSTSLGDKSGQTRPRVKTLSDVYGI